MTQSAQEMTQTDDSLHNTFTLAKFAEKTDEGFEFETASGTRVRVDLDEFDQGFPYAAGEEVELLVEQPWAGMWKASVRKAAQLRLWEKMKTMAAENAVVEGDIVGFNKGGLSVDIGVRAFCPKSQIDIHRVNDASPYLGRREKFQIIQFDEKRCNVVVSRRNLLEGKRKEQRKQIVEDIEPGQVFTGVVRNIKEYGAFVDIGGMDGLLHISNMSWGRIDHPSEMVRPGDEIKVTVLDFDPKKKRLSLGRKQILDNPWTDIEEKYAAGDIVSGKVVSLADFGAFIEIAPGLEGLVHVTELSWTQRIHHPREVLELGQEVRVKILSVDTDSRRLSLSVKQLEENPWVKLTETLKPGEVVSGPIRTITDFGLFVEVAAGVEGLVHISDISWNEKVDDANTLYKVGESVEVKILDVDVENQRLGLGIKQLSNDPWQDAADLAKPGKKIKVTITRITDFGAFAEISEGVEGLIHISELAPERVENVQQVVRPGQEVEALVVSFDRANQRIGLSLKRDELEETTAREYSDDEGATAKLGDILRDRLGLLTTEQDPGEDAAAEDDAKE
ncbi:30S ribosomal protein S1 [Bradymonas sediminis]|nr:30S ribosomal protein S1 [Bradymonas sediminis]TDP75768.1 SSU ribosomal protein S1P [Bradymonas sediminis]